MADHRLSIARSSSSPPPSPRAAARASEFKIGDKAVHPAHGVGEVLAIESRDIAGQKKSFYILKLLDSEMKLMVPTDGAARAGLRTVISKKDAEKVLGILRSEGTAVVAQPWNRRQREYVEMLKSGSPFQVARVLRDLYRLKVDKDLSFSERRLLDQARSLLVTELALARRVAEEKVDSEIRSIFGMTAAPSHAAPA
jgi:CarD family transcriptional regulator